MKRSPAADIAWAAGVFEGEGCVTHHKGHVRFQMESTDEDVLRRVCHILGGRVNGPYATPKNDGYVRIPRWHWAVGRRTEVERIAVLLYPWLGRRRRDRFDALGIGSVLIDG